MLRLVLVASLFLVTSSARASLAPSQSPPARSAAPRLIFPGDAVAPKARDPEGAARELIARHAKELHVSAAVLATLDLDAVHDIGRGGIIVTFKHRASDLEVWHDALKVLLRRDTLQLISISGQIHAALPAEPRFNIAADEAVAAALRDVAGASVRVRDLAVAEERDGAGYSRVALASSTSSSSRSDLVIRNARVKPVLAPVGELTAPAYVVEMTVFVHGVRTAASVVVDAADGRVLQSVDLVHHLAHSYRVWADVDGDHRPLDGPLGDVSPYPLELPDGHYPDVVDANLVTLDGFDVHSDPWLADDATETLGNNTDAFTDDGNPDGFTSGDVRGNTTSPGVFDHTVDFSKNPQDDDENRQAAATSLFYLVNYLHDWYYDSGFDENAHNAQHSNYGRGGVEGDELWAEAQFAAPDARDNSDMVSNDDGTSPEMQMFVWSGLSNITITAGSTELGAGVSDMGPQIFDLTADGIALDDGAAPKTDACSAATNDLTGKIALVLRGTCEFVAKVNAAEDAGAVGVIVMDDPDDGQFDQGFPPFVADDANVTPQPTIPVMSVNVDDGVALLAQVQAGTVSIHLHRFQDPDRDGAFDATVAGHEWGHYLHLRQVVCESNQCAAQSEGWGDFNAMHLTLRKLDDLDGAFPLGVFAVKASSEDAAYFGIRRYPYSVNPDKNPLTLGDIADSATLPSGPPVSHFAADGVPNSESHASGEVWAELMFNAYVALLKDDDGTPFNFEHKRRLMSDIVVGAMKIAPASPTFTEMRDAVIAASLAFSNEDAADIAQAFADRGAGGCALSPPRDSGDNEGVVEDFNLSGNYEIADLTLDDAVSSCDDDGFLDAGELGHVAVTVRNPSAFSLDGGELTLSSDVRGLTFPPGAVAIGALGPFESRVVDVTVALDPAARPVQHGSISAQVSAGPTCVKKGIEVPFLINADDASTGLTTDTVEATATSWTTDGDFSDFIWQRFQDVDGNVLWNGFDAFFGPSDTSLVSPALVVSSDADLVMSFKHRFQFEADDTSNYDGGIIEISTDGGTNWVDMATVKDPGYNGVIGDTTNQATNPLKGSNGFVNQSDGYPALVPVTVNLGRGFAGQSIQVRFRIGADEGGGAEGWDIDDIGFTGIDNAPFSGLTPNATPCASVPPAEGEGEGAGEGEGEGEGVTPPPALGCTCTSSSPGDALAFALFGFVAVLRRRR